MRMLHFMINGIIALITALSIIIFDLVLYGEEPTRLMFNIFLIGSWILINQFMQEEVMQVEAT